jgi:ribose transport system substrate-binding protein
MEISSSRSGGARGRTFWRRLSLAAALVGGAAVAAMLAGCGAAASKGPATTASKSANAGSSAPAAIKSYTSPVSSYPAVSKVSGASQLKGKSVWYVAIGESVPIIAAYGSVLQSALDKVGITTHICDGKLLPTGVASCMDQAISAHASAVVTSYVDYQMVPAAMQAVVSHKIPLLVGGEANDSGHPPDKYLQFYSANGDEDGAAHIAINAIDADSKGHANIVFIGADDSPSLKDLIAQTQRDVRSTCASCTLHTYSYLTPDIEKVPSQVSAALIQNPSTNYIFVGQDTAASQVIQGVQSAGFGTKVKIVSVDGSLAPLQTIKSGDLLTQDVGVSPIYTGWSWADGIIRMMLGHTPDVVSGGFRLFDKSNVAGLKLTPAAYATNQWYGPPKFESLFLKAWGVGS